MKKNIIIFSMMLTCSASWGAIGDIFKANATLNDNSTVEMQFRITGDNTCEVAYTETTQKIGPVTKTYKNAAIAVTTEGAIDIPSSVSNESTTYSVTSISENSFLNCDKITSVSIPNTVKTIGDKAFYECASLTSIDLSNATITSIGNQVFDDCIKLQSISFPNTVVSIGYEAFKNCKDLASIDLGDGLESIGSSCFYMCSSLTSISLPASLSSLASDAFHGCSSLASVTNNSKIPSIGATTFYGCSKLSSFSFNTEITNIGDNAFENSGLTSITIPASVTTIGTTPFNGCSALAEATVNCNLVKGMFSGCSGLKKVTLGEGVTSIPDEFFKGTALTEFSFGSAITQIGSNAFQNCTGLTSIEIPENVTLIGMNAFDGCTGLTSFTFAGTPKVTAFHDAMLKGCSGLTSIVIPSSVTSIGGSVFDGCTSLTTVDNKATLTSIGAYAFRSTKITSIELASGLESIGTGTFANITTLTSLTLPSTVKEIGSYAFGGCTGIASLTIPSNVQTIGQYAFQNCTGLKTIELPATLTSIGEEAFSGCTAATELAIANGLTTIGKKAFNGCTGIKSVTIPASVTSIAQEAFSGCTALQWIDAREATSLAPANTVRSWYSGFTGYDMFTGTPASCLIYLPKGFTLSDDEQTNDVFTDASDAATCPDFQFSTDRELSIPAGFTAEKVTLSGRSFTASTKGTLYLPFAISETDAAALGKFYGFGSVDSEAGTVSFSEVTATEGGKAYLFEPAGALSEITATNAEVKATTGEAEAVEEGLTGTYEQLTITEGLDKIFYWNTSGVFSNATSSLTVGPTRAYLQLKEAPKAGARLLATFDGQATSIMSIDASGDVRFDAVFDLQGRRVDQPRKGGLYVVNGKKVIL